VASSAEAVQAVLSVSMPCTMCDKFHLVARIKSANDELDKNDQALARF
jgi:hypothetical protein